MNYYQETHDHYNDNQQNEKSDNFDNRSILHQRAQNSSVSKDNNYDPDYDMEVNQFLEEMEKDLDLDGNTNDTVKNEDIKCNDENDNFEREKYEDYYDEFSEDGIDDVIPEWYNEMLQNKMKETKSRLEVLSTLICYTCASNEIRNQIVRIEQDHNTPFCKLDYPRHPPFFKTWQNYWRFNCTFKCKVNPSNLNHVHSSNCDIILKHVNTGTTSTVKKYLSLNEFPPYIIHAVELCQEFMDITFKDSSHLKNNEFPKTKFEKPMWNYIKLRSNYKNELMLIVCGINITPFLKHLKQYFNSGPGRTCNVVSLYCINTKSSHKKYQVSPLFISGCLELRDKIGPITIQYNPKTNMSFNSVQAHLLGKVVLEYLSPNMETTLIDLGCNYGVLSLMLAQKCDKVIGLYTLDQQIKMAEEIKLYNNLYNASFINCTPKEVHTKCSSLIKKCIAVAVLNLASPFGKSFDAIKALRNLPTLWRIIVYGSFTKEFHKYIAILTSKNDCIGDEFLPMQGCILDKSPSEPNEYDILILFERKALIEPSIELIGFGPTLNVNADRVKPRLSVDKCKYEKTNNGQMEKNSGNCDYVKNPSYKPPGKITCASASKLFDCPSTSKDTYVKSDTISQSKESKNTRLLSKSKDSSYEPRSAAHNTNIRDFNTAYDRLPVPNLENSQFCFPSTSKSNDKQFDFALPSTSSEKQYNPIQVTEKEREFNCVSVQKQENPSDRLVLPKIKNDCINSDSQNIKIKSEPVFTEKEEGELSPESNDADVNDSVLKTKIKSEPMNLSNESMSIKINLGKSEPINIDNTAIEPFKSATVKPEPLSPSKTIKTESVLLPDEYLYDSNQPIDMTISPISDVEDIHNMATPIVHPAALSHPPPTPSVSTNFTTVDGFRLFVRPNQSFLTCKTEPNVNEQYPSDLSNSSASSSIAFSTRVKQEKDIKVEERSIHVKSEKELTATKEPKKHKDKVDRNKDRLDPDLRRLIEQRKNIKKQLDRDREKRKSKHRTDRSASPEDKKYRPAPSPSHRRDRLSLDNYRTPISPVRFVEQRYRSPISPVRIDEHRYRSPVSPNRCMSPTSPNRCRSPHSRTSNKNYKTPSPSPNRMIEKRCRSPLHPSYRFRRSVSPSDKRFKRSPESPVYQSPGSSGYFDSTASSSCFESPVSPSHSRDMSRRSNSPFFDRSTAKSPVTYKSRSRSPAPSPPS